MTSSRFLSVLMLATLVRTATAQLVPPPPTATVVNFDDIVGCSSLFSPPCPVLPPDTYNSVGITIAGFGQNGATAFAAEGSSYLISPPNSLFFFSVFPTLEGGLLKTPETFSFYPPIQSLQFDTATFGGCDLIVTAQAFAPDGSSLGITSAVPVEGGVTLSVAFPASGAQTVVITDQPNPICGTVGLEAFSIDNIAFVTVAQPASKCAQGLDDAAGKQAKTVASCYAKALQKGLPVDDACLQKATDGLTKGFTSSQKKGDCLVSPDADATGAAVNAVIGQAIQMVTGGSPGPDACFGKKLTSIGKKLQAVAKCFSSGAKSGVSTDPACVQKAGASFNSSLKACGTPNSSRRSSSSSTVLDRPLASTTAPTTTTTTTTTSTTTTTAPPPLGQHL